MNKERLLNVAKALRESPSPEDFDMGTYITDCGTPGCALGHYAAREDLQSLLSLCGNRDIKFREGGSAWYADSRISEHFELGTPQLEELFDCTGCGRARTTEQAATYIEQFVANEGKRP